MSKFAIRLMVPALILIAVAFGGRAQARDMQTIVVAGGCFWCVESDFESVRGVSDVVSGYAGGTGANPTYENHSGYIEAVKITYDADQISTTDLLGLFFRSIDPTDAGGQFCDRGESYTTAVFVSNASQRSAAEAAKATAQAALGRQIVTPIRSNPNFHNAEAYHQNYYRGSNIVLTRRGPKRQSEAYKFYREACGAPTHLLPITRSRNAQKSNLALGRS